MSLILGSQIRPYEGSVIANAPEIGKRVTVLDTRPMKDGKAPAPFNANLGDPLQPPPVFLVLGYDPIPTKKPPT